MPSSRFLALGSTGGIEASVLHGPELWRDLLLPPVPPRHCHPFLEGEGKKLEGEGKKHQHSFKRGGENKDPTGLAGG